MDIVKCINYIIKFKAIFISLGKCVIHWQKACVSDKKTIYLAKDSPKSHQSSGRIIRIWSLKIGIVKKDSAHN